MKKCGKCKLILSIENFYKLKRYKNATSGYCKPCSRAYIKEWNLINKERETKRRKEWENKNRTRRTELRRLWRLKNKEKDRAARDRYNYKRAQQLKIATPSWLTKEELRNMKDIIKIVYWANSELGFRKFAVDHIVPNSEIIYVDYMFLGIYR